MKRILFRMFVVLFLTLASLFFYLDRPVSGAFDCATSVYNKWTSCDNAYGNTAQQYTVRSSYCEQTAPSACPSAAQAGCALNPSTYATCCEAASRAACEATITTTYDNRGSSYFSCMGMGNTGFGGGNFSICVEQVAGFCLEAQGRVTVCNAIYSGEDDADAKSVCLANSGIDQCL